MDKLLFSFFKRFIIVPLCFAIIAVIATGIVAPKMIANSSNAAVETVKQEIDIANYNLKDYKKFSELNKNDYVATVSVDSLKMNCPVCYASSSEQNAVELLKQSKEPWNKGTVAIVGENDKNEFKPLHNATVGTKVTIEYYKNENCTYEIKKITYNNTMDEIQKQLKKNDLVLCVPYTDFANPDGGELYIAYLAELGGVDEWK